MAEITYLEAIREALFEEMERDVNVFCLGEDIGRYGLVHRISQGLKSRGLVEFFAEPFLETCAPPGE